MSPQTFVLMQSFTEPGESEPADSIVFDQEFKARAIDSGFAIEEKSTLVGHRVDGQRIDLPRDVKPMTTKAQWDERGMVTPVGFEASQAIDFRLGRLRWWMTPVDPLAKEWQVEIAPDKERDLPGIRYSFKIASQTKVGAQFRVTLGVDAQEFDGPENLSVKGSIVLDAGQKITVVSGEWTTPSAPLPGGAEARYRLVQTLRARLAGATGTGRL